MAIQSRRGVYKDFDPDKLLPGELAVVVDGDAGSKTGETVYMCFKAGKVKRMATYEDMSENLDVVTKEVREAEEAALQAASTANNAAENAANAIHNAQTAASEANTAAKSANEASNSANAAAANITDITQQQIDDICI